MWKSDTTTTTLTTIMTTEITTDERGSPTKWGWNAAIKSLTRGLNPEYDSDVDDDYHSLDDDILKLCRTNYCRKSLSLSSSTSLDDDDDDSVHPWENLNDDDDDDGQEEEEDGVYWGVAQDNNETTTTTTTTAVSDESIYSQPAGIISYNDWAATGYASMEMVQAARETKVALDMLSTTALK